MIMQSDTGCIWEKVYHKGEGEAEMKIDQEARTRAEKDYDEARDQAWKSYQEARAQAEKTYNEARVQAEEAYQEARVQGRHGCLQI